MNHAKLCKRVNDFVAKMVVVKWYLSKEGFKWEFIQMLGKQKGVSAELSGDHISHTCLKTGCTAACVSTKCDNKFGIPYKRTKYLICEP